MSASGSISDVEGAINQMADKKRKKGSKALEDSAKKRGARADQVKQLFDNLYQLAAQNLQSASGIQPPDVKARHDEQTRYFETLRNLLGEMDRLLNEVYTLGELSSKKPAAMLSVRVGPSRRSAVLPEGLGAPLRDDFVFPGFGVFMKRTIGRNRFLPYMPCVTASRAENEFSAILEQACEKGPLAITQYNVPKAVLIACPDYDLPRRARSTLLRNLESEFEGLLASMQTSQSKQAVQTAFEASPAKLGRAAIKQASKKRKRTEV